MKVLKDFYNENLKTLKKEIEEDSKRWKKLSWIGGINTVKVSILPKNNLSLQNTKTSLYRNCEKNLKMHIEAQIS